jgi:hypothetical protein
MPFNFDQHRRNAEELVERWKPSATGDSYQHSQAYIAALATLANIDLAAVTRESTEAARIATSAMIETAEWTKRLAFFTAAVAVASFLTAIVAATVAL